MRCKRKLDEFVKVEIWPRFCLDSGIKLFIYPNIPTLSF